MDTCNHNWEMADIRYGYLVVEACARCGGRSSFFSTEVSAPIDEYQEGDHFWTHWGHSQAVKFNLKCVQCGDIVGLDDMVGLMMSTCDDPQCQVAQLSEKEGKDTWVYVALCADSTHASGKCVSEEGIEALNGYFNQRIQQPGKKILVVPCRQCCSIDVCKGLVLADTGLTEMEEKSVSKGKIERETMKISELAEKTGFKAINEYKDKEIEGVYISDMVSDIITCPKANVLLVTLQTHKNLIATANLVDVAAIVFSKGKMPEEDVIELADRAGIALFSTGVDTWALASKLHELGLG